MTWIIHIIIIIIQYRSRTKRASFLFPAHQKNPRPIAFKSTDYDLYTLHIAAAGLQAGDGASCILDGLSVGVASVKKKKEELEGLQQEDEAGE